MIMVVFVVIIERMLKRSLLIDIAVAVWKARRLRRNVPSQ